MNPLRYILTLWRNYAKGKRKSLDTVPAGIQALQNSEDHFEFIAEYLQCKADRQAELEEKSRRKRKAITKGNRNRFIK